jgi:hypothetical protein
MDSQDKTSYIKKSLIIGINYISNDRLRLRGCYNDALLMRDMLNKHYKCPINNTLMLVDNDSRYMPTKQNIELGIKWLLCSKCTKNEFYKCPHDIPHRSGTHIAFHYSGHGLQKRDISGDEVDMKDECLVPVDFMTTGIISDDYLFKNLCQQVPSDVNLYCTIDMCNSETSMDLKYTIINGRMFPKNKSVDTIGNVIQVSTSLDGSSSADMNFNGTYYGAGTKCLIETIQNHNYDIKCVDLISEMNLKLKKLYPQIVRLSFGNNSLNINTKFY